MAGDDNRRAERRKSLVPNPKAAGLATSGPPSSFQLTLSRSLASFTITVTHPALVAKVAGAYRNFNEISQVTGWSESLVKVRAYRARLKLRQLWKGLSASRPLRARRAATSG